MQTNSLAFMNERSIRTFSVSLSLKNEMVVYFIVLGHFQVRNSGPKHRNVLQLRLLNRCPLMPFGTNIQITAEANVARECKDTENILVLINLQCMLSYQIYKS